MKITCPICNKSLQSINSSIQSYQCNLPTFKAKREDKHEYYQDNEGAWWITKEHNDSLIEICYLNHYETPHISIISLKDNKECYYEELPNMQLNNALNAINKYIKLLTFL